MVVSCWMVITWNPTERAALARLNAASVERSFVPARDVAWSGCTSPEEWLSLYRAWSLFPGSRFESRFSDETRVNFARYQQASLMLVTAMLERHGLPMLEDLLRGSQDPEFIEYVSHFIKEEAYHYAMFMRAIAKIEGEMPGYPGLPRAGTERLLKMAYRVLRWVPGRRFRTTVSFTMFRFAEQVSVHAHGVAREVVPREDSLVPQVWALHAVDEGRHLQFDGLLLQKLALPSWARRFGHLLAVPLCVVSVLAVHLNEAWAARQLGVRVRLWHLLGPFSTPASHFQQRVTRLMRNVARGS